jgi:hypothetical protein
MGFRVAGLSSIARCPSNVAQDGFIRAVRDDASDKLCLDGKRLVPVGEDNGSVEYRTFPDTFVRVLALSHKGWGSKKGPHHFEVYERSGRISEYGDSDDSQVRGAGGVVRAWAISKTSDRRGNYLAYTYRNDPDPTGSGATIEQAPLRIDYTGRTGFVSSKVPLKPRSEVDARTIGARPSSAST